MPGEDLQVRYVLGLDPSVCHTGWALYDRAEEQFTYGTFEPPGEVVGDLPRMDFMRQRLLELLSGLQPGSYGRLAVFIEGMAFAAQGNVALQLAGVGFILRLALWERAIRYCEITPNQAKKFLTGKGQAQKNLILLKTFQKYGIECGNDNEADAINFNMIGRAALGWTTPKNEAERSVVAALNRGPQAKVRKPRKPKAA